MTSPTTTLDSKAVADALGIEAKALRVFLRSGKAEGMFTRDSKAYVFTKADVAKIKKAYAIFVADRVAAKAAKDAVAAKDDEVMAS
jgi:predicted site-specific integrase-resolvase